MESQIFDSSIHISEIEELRGEQNYFNEIKRLEGMGKIIKFGKIFESKNEAINYINKTPSKAEVGALKSYLPNTDWVIRDNDGKVEALAIVEEIKGTRLDKSNLSELNPAILDNFDKFIFESLLIYERDGVCPGINLKNFLVDDNDKLYYVDSEPFPPYTIKSFEMAHARRQTLTKLFGDGAKTKFPNTWQWIEKNEVSNYRKAKREKKRERQYKVVE